MEGDYVNANFVDSALKQGDRKMIAAQGPLEETVEAFWRMVLQEKVKLIVSVCKLQESGRSKCHKYWPDSTGDAQFNKLMKGSIEVKKVGETKIG
jgi:protein tyrosine phosphatase